MQVEIAPPSSAQMKKLHSGQPFRATIGSGLKIHVPDHVGKKLMKASMKGLGATVDGCSCMGCGMCGGSLPARTPRGIAASYTPPPTPPPLGGNVKATAKDSAKRLMEAGTDRAVRALEGSGKNKHYMRSAAQMALMLGNPASVHGRGYGGNVKATAKDSGKRLIVAGTDRAVRALEGSGRSRYFEYNEGTGEYERVPSTRRGGNVKATAKDSAKRLMVAGTDRAVRALEGSGYGGAINPFVKQVKKQEKKQDQQKDELMKQMNQQMKKQSSIMKKAKEAQKTQSATANKELMQQVTQQVKKTKQLINKAQDLREEAVDTAKADFRGQMRHQAKQMPTIGGKVNRRKKFDNWFKSIGSKFKTLNHNLAPVKKAATNRAVQYITYTNNPTAQGKALLDMAQEEFGDDGAEVAPVATTQMMNQGVSPQQLSQAVASKFKTPKIKKVKQPKMKKMKEEAQPIDVNGDGEPDGYFYPREVSYFGAGVNPHYAPYVSPSLNARAERWGNGMGEMGRPTIMPVVPFQRPVPVRSGKGAKKSSPWIEHVKAYCKKHGCKYSDGLKQAKSTYKKGGALYPAGYDPNYD